MASSEAGSERAAIVIVGGGILGCSIAWHLARAGARNVVVVERNDFASAATSRSAGLVSRGRLHAPTLRLVGRTRAAIDELEHELGEPAGFHRVGSLRLAASEARAAELESMDALLREHGAEVRRIDAAEARELVPWLDPSSARHISCVPDDGYVDAYLLTLAYARAARARGVRFVTRTSVSGVLVDAGRVCGVETSAGRLHCEALVNAAGAWGIELARSVGARLGTAPVRSHYWITAPAVGRREHPLVYLPDARAYARPEVGGLLLGVQEPQSRAYDARMLPDDIGRMALTGPGEEWDLLVEHAETLRPWIPGLDELNLAHHVAGLSTYTPDGRFLLGAAGASGHFVASGCCGNGVSASGGIGEALADLVLGLPPKHELAPFDPARFDVADPFAPEFLAACAAARSAKSRR